ncbi:MAG TPA: hypothetical protein VGJ73_04295, partial [Verrucomicrobiae bacterium]
MAMAATLGSKQPEAKQKICCRKMVFNGRKMVVSKLFKIVLTASSTVFISKFKKGFAKRMLAYASALAMTVAVSPTMSLGALSAYYTNIPDLSTGNESGKYADIIIKAGKDKQLEFTRATAYLPVWRTPAGAYNINALITREPDPHFYYTQARLLQNDTHQVVVQLKYYEGISALSNAIHALDPLVPYGITGLVLETFTIKDNNTVE